MAIRGFMSLEGILLLRKLLERKRVYLGRGEVAA